jgi:thymidine kinase
MNKKMNNGYLELIIGPMFSGKTSYLIDKYHTFTDKYDNHNINILVINYELDKRYSDSCLVNHNNKSIPCIFCKELKEIDNDTLDRSHVILINEGQFFPDIYSEVKNWVDHYKKKIYIAALDGDFNREPFGNFLNLISISDDVKKLRANCHNCTFNKASFSHRISDETDKIVIGGSNKYIPLCRNCYISVNN